MTSSKFRILVNKYAILIFIGYALSFIISTIVFRFLPDTINNNYLLRDTISLLPTLIQLTINIIAAFMISKDLQELQIRNNLIVIMTVLFSLIGVTMFFISVNREMKNAST